VKVLVLSFYYEPDLSAGSFRATALVRALKEKIDPSSSIDVVTTMPNRYRSFARSAEETVSEGGVEIRRIPLPAHSSDIRGQVKAFGEFARQSLRFAKNRHYDLVIATSSRLMTAALGALIARRKNARLYLDIRDIFVDTIGDLFKPPLRWPLKHVFSLLEGWTMRRAARINLVSQGFEQYFRDRYPEVPRSFFTNGIDDEFLRPLLLTPKAAAADRRPLILYAGNLGDGQSLHRILPGMAHALNERARFVVYGDGGRRRELEAAVAGLSNVELRDPVDRERLIAAYEEADVLFLHLGAYAAFEKVLPSKVFEYAALGKPVLAGVAGYAARFIREEVENSAVFAPCDVTAGVAAFRSLDLAQRPRPAFNAKFARANIMRAMAADILA
jgi:glycosyltransferase involved in cell wall biosynthesis